jgi:hypothetical protein
MKKISLVSLLFILVFAACKKVENRAPVSNTDRFSLIKGASCIRNQIPFEHLFDNCQDASEKRIDQGHYYLMKSMLSLTNDKRFLDLIALSKTAKNNCISLSQIVKLKPEILPKSFDSNECNVEHNGLYYKTVVFVPNADHANYSLSPIISAGIELYDDEYDEQDDNHDVIYGWYLDEYNDTIEINLGAGDCVNTSRPILVASLELCEGQEEKIADMNIPKLDIRNRTSFCPIATSLKVNYRYDNTKYSEVHFSSVQTNTSSAFDWIHDKLGDVNRNGIGSSKSIGNWYFPSTTVNSPSNERICYNTYEYDWYASPKPLGYCYFKGSSSGTKNYVAPGNRKFYDEWYGYPPGDLSPFEIPLGDLTTTPTNFDWFKGSIELKK